MYSTKVINKARKRGFKWLTNNKDGIYGYKLRPFIFDDVAWMPEDDDYERLGKGKCSNWRDSLYEIPPGPVYPKWVIKAAKHHDCRWIAMNADDSIFAYAGTEDTPPPKPGRLGCFMATSDAVGGIGPVWKIVSCYYPIDIGVSWRESLMEIAA